MLNMVLKYFKFITSRTIDLTDNKFQFNTLQYRYFRIGFSILNNI